MRSRPAPYYVSVHHVQINHVRRVATQIAAQYVIYFAPWHNQQVCNVTQNSCRIDHIHSPAENGWQEYQRQYGYKQTGYGPQGSHEPPDSRTPKTSIFGGLKDTVGDAHMALPVQSPAMQAV